MLREYLEHYNTHRPHRSLDQQPPADRTPPPSNATLRPLRRDRLGGLLHEYVQVARRDRVLGTHRLQGEYAEARRLDEDTLRRREEVLGENHPDTVASANNLIVDLLELGDSERARHLDERIGRSEPGDQ